MRYVERNERLRKMVGDFSSGFYERLFRGWNGATKDRPFSTEEGYNFSVYCREILLPILIDNLDQNRLRIAYLLSFTNSNQLDKRTKEKLGIEDVVVFDREYQIPSLFRCADKGWGWQCDNVDASLGDIHLTVESGVSVDLFEFCGCMVGKQVVLTSGYCFRTTEFPQSGAIFMIGANYMLRSWRALTMVEEVGKGKKVSEVEKVDGVADMYYMGGVWQPTRLLNQGMRC